ncbi:MAG: T9SS type A sorting domain-containing protein [Ignavibacteria bacterium]|nr:T9SS type A sorting domain-containing protein [Ignavibacteria bacterium]
MKSLLILIFCLFCVDISLSNNKEPEYLFPKAVIRAQVVLNANNISAWVQNTGIFNNDIRTTNTPGFEWPKGSRKFAVFTTGLSMGTYINNELRLATISYNGEYAPGYTRDGIFYTNNNFKLYKVKRGDNSSTNPDYANWNLMVPYGAPFYDVNNNGIFEPLIDTPGVKNSEQTVFVCLTDADAGNHTQSEGFSGGTLPVFSEMHFTAWSYTASSLADVQFIKMEIVNRNNSPWNKTYFGLICDPDLGDVQDDRMGCDTNRALAFCYNGDNQDGSYGTNPPAVGFDMLKGAEYNNKNTQVKMSSFSYYERSGGAAHNVCEWPPSTPIHAYNYMKGFKRDGTVYINPLTKQKTKYNFPGDPETGTGWTEYNGIINNCGGVIPDSVISLYPREVHFMQNSGADDLTILPGAKQTFIFAQMIARGTNNLNSVTKFKELDDYVQSFYDSNYTIWITPISNVIPDNFFLYQNYPNPFNPSTNIKFEIPQSDFVNLSVYDINGKLVEELVNENISAGIYEVKFSGKNLSSGIYFYRLKSSNSVLTNKMTLIK